ncbi:CheR family methyltransferase [Rhodovulum visakhapatnamense]|uniref:Two-component system CheB/CheR fusion protein n=1 Tax=Rhodovulum visakhapatnamense TaxID=364297 RepID=A0A4R8G1G6_9RHOB|nr:chemotaxis protein CheB [Rhodovulum visakhapatnamense]TDX31857.1 two-component system CheB/CheR fusion protein [Rhodovulum visakhapatnamense]
MGTEADPRQLPDEIHSGTVPPIVGIGASAGGLSALETFFENCPSDSGAAFVVIQHLSPKHKSLMAGLLARRTAMPVSMIETDTRVAANHVYLIPPGTVMRIDRGVLRLAPRNEGLSLPIDIFFSSLAEDCGDRASGIVLSGTGSDGTRGAIAINAAGGLVLIQDTKEANFDGMPMSVRRAGVVDAELPVSDLARRVLEHRSRPPKIPFGPEQDAETGQSAAGSDGSSGETDTLEVIFQALEDATGTNYRLYKGSTILRRIGRRMQVLGQPDLQSYVDLMLSSPGEVTALNRELLISVTRFFRDEDAFRVLEETVVPRIVESLGPDQTARAWVAGCSTGEEAYSIAILLHEAFHRAGRTPMVKVFATDVSQDSLQFASAGTYPASVGAEISPERMERYFIANGDTVQVSSELRQSLVFARHDLLSNPPFTRMDLVSCRNTLIYFRQDAQKDALLRLQYAIRKAGFLFLGSSETLSSLQNGFQPVDSKHKVFVRVSARPSAQFDLSALKSSTPFDHGLKSRQFAVDRDSRPTMSARAFGARGPVRESLTDMAINALLDAWAPPSILVNDKLEAIHFFGDLRPFLLTRSGVASLELVRLLPKTLVAMASVLIHQAIETAQAQASEQIEVRLEENASVLRLHAIPFAGTELGACVLLSFETVEREPRTTPEGAQRIDLTAVAQARIDILERQLDSTRADLQTTIQELETSNEELQSTNEELMASNEELQSSNEELQSVNEEINTVNAEYQEKMAMLNRLNADLTSMIRAVGVATVFLDEALLITRFSPDACSVFKLRESDVGRPLGDIAHRLKYPALLDDIRDTIRTEVSFEREATAEDGALYRVRIMPYAVQSTGHRGAVVTLTNVTVYRDLARLQGVIDALPEHIAVLDFDGTIVLTNKAWTRFARANGDSGLERCGPGANYLEVCRSPMPGQPVPWDPEDQRIALRALEGLKSILEGSQTYFALEYPCHSPSEQRWFYMTAATVAGSEFGAVVSHIEITSWFRNMKQG